MNPFFWIRHLTDRPRSAPFDVVRTYPGSGVTRNR